MTSRGKSRRGMVFLEYAILIAVVGVAVGYMVNLSYDAWVSTAQYLEEMATVF